MIFNRHISALCCAALLAAGMTSCLDSKESEHVQTNLYNAIVTNFQLESNSDVCANLSGYQFTIDNYGYSDPELHRQYPDDGIIFNADSLPAGSIPDSIKVTLTCSAPDSVYFKLYDPFGRLGQFSNYSSDSALFAASYPDCRLTLVARGFRKTYHVKVNVHKVKGDTVMWHPITDQLWTGLNITDQRTDTLGGRYLWYVEDDGLRLKVGSSPIGDACRWSDLADVAVADGVLPDLSTLYHWHDALYAVSKDNRLLTTADGLHWTGAKGSEDMQFCAILGNQCRTQNVYGQWNSDSLNAIVKVDGQLRFATTADAAQWTLHQQVPEGFPVKGFSRPIYTEARNKYGNLTSRLYLTGGITATGELVAGTWSCDGWNADVKGVNWQWFEQNEMPAMYGASVIEYTLDATQPKSFWILQPGITATGDVPTHRLYGKTYTTLYFSQDHGVSWHRLSRYYTQYADNAARGLVSCNSTFCEEDSYRMLHFGGRMADGKAVTSVWSGVLNSLTFEPQQ